MKTRIKAISRFGNIVFDIKEETFKTLGYEPGDFFRVSFGAFSFDSIPYAYNYQNVGIKKPVLLFSFGNLLIGLNNGDFSKAYGIDNSYLEADALIEVVSRKARVFYDLTYSDQRDAYPELNDEEFANFRCVEAAGLKKDFLFRGASPLCSDHQRDVIIMKALERHKISSIINMIDLQNEAETFATFKDSYYASLPVLYLGLYTDEEEYRKGMAETVRFLLHHPAPFYFHCLEGKDRTAYYILIFLALIGISYSEIEEDYLLSFIHYYRIKKGSPIYEEIRNNFKTLVDDTLKCADFKKASLQKSAENYLLNAGVSREEIAALKKLLKA